MTSHLIVSLWMSTHIQRNFHIHSLKDKDQLNMVIPRLTPILRVVKTPILMLVYILTNMAHKYPTILFLCHVLYIIHTFVIIHLYIPVTIHLVSEFTINQSTHESVEHGNYKHSVNSPFFYPLNS